MENMFREFLERQKENPSAVARPNSANMFQETGLDVSVVNTADGDEIREPAPDDFLGIPPAGSGTDDSRIREQNATTDGLEALPTPRKTQPAQYTDEFGILDVDSSGELRVVHELPSYCEQVPNLPRYVGAGATVNVWDTCDGLRRHIVTGLQRKGYETKEYYFGTPSDSKEDDHPPLETSDAWTMPPQRLVDVLVRKFYECLYDVFPIIQHAEFQRQYHEILTTGDMYHDFVPVLFALLAVSAPLLGLDHSVFQEPECLSYRHDNLSLYFYSIASNSSENGVHMPIVLGGLRSSLSKRKNSSNKVIALGLMSMFLAGAGHEAEAWTVTGRAVTLGQDLGFHVRDSPSSWSTWNSSCVHSGLPKPFACLMSSKGNGAASGSVCTCWTGLSRFPWAGH